MPDVTFYHPDLDDPGPYLTVPTGMDEIQWGYNLNAVTFPTYGGEVIQILSVFVNELTITGTLSNYHQMDKVYRYFAQYLQIASQGKPNNPDKPFNQKPIIMTYPERNWSFKIMVTGVPGFRRHRDLVAPQWQITAHVIDDSEDLHHIKDFIESETIKRFLESDGEDFALEGKIGFRAENPFSAPGTAFGDNFNAQRARKIIDKTMDQYEKVIEAYLDSDIEQIYQESFSRPSGDQWQDAKDQKKTREHRARGNE